MVSAVYPVRQKIREDERDDSLNKERKSGEVFPSVQDGLPNARRWNQRHQCVTGRDCQRDSSGDGQGMNCPAAEVNEQGTPPPMMLSRSRPAAFHQCENGHQDDELDCRGDHAGWAVRRLPRKSPPNTNVATVMMPIIVALPAK